MQEQEFARQAFCILGLPIDRCSEDDLLLRFLTSKEPGPVVVLTPNLQISRLSHHDATFRENLCRSDLLLADGMPLVWCARLLDLPIADRTTGAGSIQRLLETAPANSLKVKFFGGTGGTCAEAVRQVSRYSRVTIVAWYEPPLATVDELSGPAYLSSISSEKSDLLLTSLSSQKAAEWLGQNKDRLNSRFLMEFGAGLKFLARKIRRAPPWFQRRGLEWLWRTTQEPVLIFRYFSDGIFFLKALLLRVLPLALWIRIRKRQPERRQVVFWRGDELFLQGDFSDDLGDGLLRTELLNKSGAITVNLDSVEFLGCGAMALLQRGMAGKQLTLRAKTFRAKLLLWLHDVRIAEAK